MTALFSRPKVPAPPPTPTEADASAAAKGARRNLQIGRIPTLLTGGQGIEMLPQTRRPTLLGGG